MSTSFRLPIVHDNFFDPTTWRELCAYVFSQEMKYGSKSNSATDPHGHWAWKPIYDEQQNLADLTRSLPGGLAKTWGRVQDKCYQRPGRAVIRSYANGYTYGTDGYFHFDSTRADEDTIIIYMCEKWDADWAGETVFLNNNNRDICYAVLPKPNRVVVAPSNLEHCARAVSRKCNVLRRTLMFKTRPLRPPGWERLSHWLVGNGALTHEHQRGSLHDHLMRVADLMARRPCPAAACVAGALHSIYGTNAFPHKLLEPTLDNRARVANTFGQEAENLAHMFSVIDRPRCLENAASFKDYAAAFAHGRFITLKLTHMAPDICATGTEAMALCLIEAANLLDQGGLDKYPNLKALWETTRPKPDEHQTSNGN